MVTFSENPLNLPKNDEKDKKVPDGTISPHNFIRQFELENLK